MQNPPADPWDENSEAINWTNARVGLGSWEYIPGLVAGWPQLLEVRAWKYPLRSGAEFLGSKWCRFFWGQRKGSSEAYKYNQRYLSISITILASEIEDFWRRLLAASSFADMTAGSYERGVSNFACQVLGVLGCMVHTFWSVVIHIEPVCVCINININLNIYIYVDNPRLMWRPTNLPLGTSGFVQFNSVLWRFVQSW